MDVYMSKMTRNDSGKIIVHHSCCTMNIQHSLDLTIKGPGLDSKRRALQRLDTLSIMDELIA